MFFVRIIGDSGSIVDDSRSIMDNYKGCSKLWHHPLATLEVSFTIRIFVLHRPLVTSYNATTVSIRTVSRTILSIMTLSITKRSIKTLLITN